MYRVRADPDRSSDRARHAFSSARGRVVERLVGAGVERATGDALVDEWLRSTEMLSDFIAAPDYWQLAYRFALDEYRRRASARLVPFKAPAHRSVSAGPATRSD
jgi:hypothetical protein